MTIDRCYGFFGKSRFDWRISGAHTLPYAYKGNHVSTLHAQTRLAGLQQLSASMSVALYRFVETLAHLLARTWVRGDLLPANSDLAS